jgi:hypothetical protein
MSENKTNLIIISVFNTGSLALAINHLTSLRNQQITNYMAFAQDENTFQTVKSLGFNVQPVSDIPFFTNEKKDFGTPDFVAMSFVRYKVIHEMLQKYDAVWYLDVDSVVLADINQYFAKSWASKRNVLDMVFQNDIHMICSGCVLYFSNEKTIQCTKHVYDHMNRYIPDQHFVAGMLQQNPDYFQIELMDYMDFPNGLLYFDSSDTIGVPPNLAYLKKDYNDRKGDRSPQFVHANWMVGNENKERALRKYGLFYTK